MVYKIIFTINKTGETKEREFIHLSAQEAFIKYCGDKITILEFTSK